MELGRLLDAVRRDLGSDVADGTGGGFQGWEAALRFLAAQATAEPLLVVLDEVPYLARSTPGFPSIVQAVWDHLAPGTKLLLVLVGSSIGTMEGLIGGGGALRGRPTVRLRLDPMDLRADRLFLPSLSPVALVEAYAACGGYPLHLRAWDPGADTRQNLLRLALASGGHLLEEATGILREELPETGGYFRILAAVGRGRTRYSEIAGEAEQRIEHPLSVLVDAGLLRRCSPVGAPRGSRPVYEIADPYLAFWYRVLYADLPLVETGQGAALWSRIAPRWSDHLGRVFEELAREHARRLVASGELPEDLVVGRWWSVRGEPCEIDVLGLRGSRVGLVGEVRWQSTPLGRPALEALCRKASRVRAADPVLALWGRNGIRPELEKEGVLGLGASDVVGV